MKQFGPEILYIGKVGGNGGTAWGIDPGGDQQTAGGDVNQPTFIVAKLTLGPAGNDDTVEIFINPDPGTVAPTNPDLAYAFNEDPNNNRAMDEVRIGGMNGAFAVDEIRIGATYADVAPGTPIDDCVADLTGDGILDLSDINAFVSAFTTQGGAADLDGNGIWDLNDINLFVAAFVAGCP